MGRMTASTPRRLSDLPTRRLLALLRDAERTVGPDSQTARTLSRILDDRLAAEEARQRRTAPAEMKDGTEEGLV
jgi:hypothetical protein